MKYLLLVSAVVGLSTVPLLRASELTPASVAEQLAKDEGYRFFTFHADAARSYQIVLRLNDTENVQNTLDLPAAKDYVVAVRLSKHNALEAVRVYSDNGSVSVTFPDGHFPEFIHTISQSVIQLGDPFLTLDNYEGKLQLVLRTPKA